MAGFTPQGNLFGATTASLQAISPASSSQTFWGNNAYRIGGLIYNGGTQPAYVALAAAATVGAYSFQMPASALYELPTPTYCGPVSVVWASGSLGSGSLLVTEISQLPLWFLLVTGSNDTEIISGVPGPAGPTGNTGPAGSAGFNRSLGPVFSFFSALANQSSALMYPYGVTALGAAPFVAQRSGSVTGISGFSSVAAAGSDLTLTVFKNGASLGAVGTITAGKSSGSAVFSPGTFPFATGDTLDVRYSTTVSWSALTANVSAYVEISTQDASASPNARPVLYL